MLGRSSKKGSPTTPSEREVAAARAAHALMENRGQEARKTPESVIPSGTTTPRAHTLQEFGPVRAAQAPAHGRSESTQEYDLSRDDSVEEKRESGNKISEMKGIPMPDVHLKRTDHPVENAAAAQRETEQQGSSEPKMQRGPKELAGYEPKRRAAGTGKE